MTITKALEEFFKEEDFYSNIIKSLPKIEKDEKFDKYIQTLDTIYGNSLKQSIHDKLEKTENQNHMIERVDIL